MQATPEDTNGKRAKHSRIEQIRRDGGELKEPPVTLAYLLAWLDELGWCSGTAAGPVVLRPTELQAWQDLAGVQLIPWEARALLAGSRAFVRGFYSDDPKPPYGALQSAANAELVQSRIDRMFE